MSDHILVNIEYWVALAAYQQKLFDITSSCILLLCKKWSSNHSSTEKGNHNKVIQVESEKHF